VSDDDPYCYPGSTVLRNKLGLTDPEQLAKVERRLVVQRAIGACPKFCVRGITNAEEAYYAKQSQEG